VDIAVKTSQVIVATLRVFDTKTKVKINMFMYINNKP
jgi:hypothetical protein